MVAKSMRNVPVVLCFLFSFVLMFNVVAAYSEPIEVPARDRCTRDVSLNQDDLVSGRIIMVGSSINFSISDPDGQIVLAQTITDPTDFQFSAEKPGTYSFHFENWFSDEVKFVTLNYNVQHYIFGFPQEYVILFVIVGLALVAVVIFVAMSPKP